MAVVARPAVAPVQGQLCDSLPKNPGRGLSIGVPLGTAFQSSPTGNGCLFRMFPTWQKETARNISWLWGVSLAGTKAARRGASAEGRQLLPFGPSQRLLYAGQDAQSLIAITDEVVEQSTNVGYWQILLQKSFCIGDRKF